MQALTEYAFRISGHTQKCEGFETIQENLTTDSRVSQPVGQAHYCVTEEFLTDHGRVR